MVVLLATLLGSCVGSFANVFLHRSPRGISLWRPASACPHCGHGIRWRHNLPVLGWFILRGRCHDCGERISLRYPALEAAFGGLAGASVYRLGSDPMGWLFTGFFLVLLLIALYDWDTMIIPLVCTLPLGLVGLTMSVQFPGLYGAWWVSAASALGAYSVMLLLLTAGRAWFGKEALGGGDVSLMAAAAGFLGWPGSLQALVLGNLLGLPLMLAFMSSRGMRWERRTPAPFGPGLCLGCALAGLDLVTGDVSWVLGRVGLAWLDLRSF